MEEMGHQERVVKKRESPRKIRMVGKHAVVKKASLSDL